MTKMRTFVLGLVVLLLPVTGSPAPDPPQLDPGLFAIFLRVHANLYADIQKASAQNPAAANSAASEITRSISISQETFVAMVKAYTSLSTQLAGIDEEGNSYVRNQLAKRSSVDPVPLRRFESRRLETIRGAITRLKGSLPATEWASVETYLRGTFQQYVKRSPLQ